MVSKLMKQDKPGANPNGNTPVEKDLYFFHPDHLGSSNYITDSQGQLFEHLEYFPFGETWVQEHSNTQRTPYLFTGKEFDEETNLYYYGARYYDPRTSVWQSADPILGRYLGGPPTGGVFNSFKLALYTYGLQNPVKYFDPDGLYDRVGHLFTPQAAALAAGLPLHTAAEIGRAAWAPDEDSRSATSVSSSFSPYTNRINIHALNGNPSGEVQAKALTKLRSAIKSMTLDRGFRFSTEGENTLHYFGDSAAHQKDDRQYEPKFGHASDSMSGHDPDNPHTHPDRFLTHAGQWYDVLSGKAQEGGLKPRMSRQDFMDRMK